MDQIDTRYEPDRSRMQIDASRELRDLLEQLAKRNRTSVRALVLYGLAEQYPVIRQHLANENIKKNYGAVRRLRQLKG